MKLNSEPVRNWFGYSRRERRSSSILLSVIIVIMLLRYLLPEKNMEIVQFGILPADTANNQESSENLEPYVKVSSYSSQKKEYRSPVQKKPLLDLNSCDSISLVALPGIGPVLSARIIKYRNLLGGFARIEQLREVYGLPEETYVMIKGRLFADTSLLRKTNVNSSGFRDLSRIPYLEKYEVTAILKFVELAGRVNSIDDLKTNKILSPEKADKVEPYMDFR